LVTAREKCIHEGGMDFFEFDPAWVHRVDFGARHAPDLAKKTRDLLAADFPNAKCYDANYHPTQYALS
jgi:hypothetical protein